MLRGAHILQSENILSFTEFPEDENQVLLIFKERDHYENFMQLPNYKILCKYWIMPYFIILLLKDHIM